MNQRGIISSQSIPDNVLAVLSAGRCEGLSFFPPEGRLPRRVYESMNKVLVSLGGKWNTATKSHIFNDPCELILESVIESGAYVLQDHLGWFSTPPAIVSKLIDMAVLEPGMEVLEPSAGEGAIALAVRAAGADVYCVEIDSGRFRTLCEQEHWAVALGDFLQHNPSRQFDRIVMNPPFAKRADIKHVLHAREFLKPDGLLVSVMSAGILFREDAISRSFRKQCLTIEELPNDTFEELTDDAFKSSGTNVRTALITMGPSF